MNTNILNLRERYGRQFKIAFDEAYYAERGRGAWADDPALQIIPGRLGHVYPASGGRLAAFGRSGPTAAKLRALPYAEVWTDGSDGVTVLFPPDRLNEVAHLLHLKRRRRVSDQERARLAEVGRQYQFRPRSHGVQSDSEGRICDSSPLVDV